MPKPIKKKKAATQLSGQDAYAPVELQAAEIEARHTEASVKRPRPSPTLAHSRSMEITKEVFANVVETLTRLSPDDMTVFDSSMLIRDSRSGQTWREPIGSARRISKEDPRAKMLFEYETGLIITALSEEGILVKREEFDPIPFCDEHS